MTNAKLTSLLSTLGAGALGWLFVNVFHTHIPLTLDLALPAAAALAVNLGVGKLVADVEPEASEVLRVLHDIQGVLTGLTTAAATSAPPAAAEPATEPAPVLAAVPDPAPVPERAS
jgi:hypothetical protein